MNPDPKEDLVEEFLSSLKKRSRLTDEDLAEVFSIIDTEETQDNGDEGTEEQPPPEAYAFGD